MRRPLLLATLSSLTTAAAPGPAAADALALVAPGPIGRVVAAGPGVAVLRDGAVWLLDADGRVGARCLGVRDRPERAARADGTARAPEEVLREVGISDEDESPEAEALLDDEGGAWRARRRAPVDRGGPRALDVAGGADAAWIGAGDGVWRLDARTSRCRRAGLAGHAVERVAAAGPLVVALSGATVWRGDQAAGAFEVAGVLSSRARAAAVAEDGTIFVADDSGVVRVGPAHAVRRVVEDQVEALVACGPVVYVLGGGGLYRLNGADVQRLGAPPPAHALACAWPRLVAVGAGMWSSDDGAAWTEEGAGLGRAFTGVAVAAGRAWLATEDGLFVPVAGAPTGDEVPTPPRRRRAASPPLWAALLPRVAVVFDGWTESPGRAGWRLWLSLSVSLDRPALVRIARAPEAGR